MDLDGEIRRAQDLGQKLEDLVVNAGKITIKTEAPCSSASGR
jgi:hypothetical protein